MSTYTTLKSLKLSWSVSKGRDTYGYNICRLDDTQTGKRFRCSGGGYDMVGTCLAQWLVEYYQDELKAAEITNLYGVREWQGKITVDGACGVSSVIRIINAIGFDVQEVYNKKKGGIDSFIITNKEAA